MFSTFSTYISVMLAIVIIAYIAIRVIAGKMQIWDKADTQEDAHAFRSAIFSYKPIYLAYAAWLAIAVNTFVAISKDGMLNYLPVIYVIAYQLWKMRTPRDYRGSFGKVMCGLLPFTLAFYCITYPINNPYVFGSLLVWIIASMLMQLVTLRAIDQYDFKTRMQRYAVFSDYNVFGEAGRGLSNSNLDAGNVDVGLIGEKKTEVILNKLASEHRNLFVFHSVAWVSNSTYDIDHVLYYKGSMIFLDSKFWGQGKHEIDADGNVYKNGSPRDLKVHLPVAMEEYLSLISSMNSPVQHSSIWVVVHGNDESKVTIGENKTDGKSMFLMSAADLAFEVKHWMSIIDGENNSIQDSRVLAMFNDRVKL